MCEKPILSICIATYNRADTLIELVNNIIKNQRDDIEIVVTDNASTDDTVERLHKINDKRLRVCVNETNIGGANNTLKAVYNARGKYALYCNDRDLIGTESIDNIIEVLYSNRLSFAYLFAVNKDEDRHLEIYTNIVDSFVKQFYTHHPTGMIFNREIINENNITIDDLYNCNVLYALDFLAREIFIFAPTAVIYDVVSYEREKTFKIKNVSKFQSGKHKIFFMPDVRREVMKQTIEHIDSIVKNIISTEEYMEIILSCCKYFYKGIIVYKAAMNDMYEAAHYGFERKYIKNREIRVEARKFNELITQLLIQRKQYSALKVWKRILWKMDFTLFLQCIKYDVIHMYKRENNERIF